MAPRRESLRPSMPTKGRKTRRASPTGLHELKKQQPEENPARAPLVRKQPAREGHGTQRGETGSGEGSHPQEQAKTRGEKRAGRVTSAPRPEVRTRAGAQARAERASDCSPRASTPARQPKATRQGTRTQAAAQTRQDDGEEDEEEGAEGDGQRSAEQRPGNGRQRQRGEFPESGRTPDAIQSGHRPAVPQGGLLDCLVKGAPATLFIRQRGGKSKLAVQAVSRCHQERT